MDNTHCVLFSGYTVKWHYYAEIVNNIPYYRDLLSQVETQLQSFIIDRPITVDF